jgi:hypothetical protein
MCRIPHIAGMFLLGVLFASLLGFALGWIVMLLWNWLLPALFGVVKIGYLQGVGIFILGRLLFGAWGRHGYHGGRGFHGGHGRWKHYNDYWENEGKAAFEQYVKKQHEKN